MKILSSIFCFLFSLVSFAECSCCCCNGDSGGSDDGGGQGSGDSCVQMSPADCEGIKFNLSSSLSTARHAAADGQERVVSELQSILNDSIPLLVSDLVDINNSLSLLSTTNDALLSSLSTVRGRINNAKTQLQNAYDSLSSVGAGALFVSNVTSGTTTSLSSSQNPLQRVRISLLQVTNALSSIAISYSLASDENQVISSCISSLQSISSNIEQLETTVENVSDAAEEVFTSIDREINLAQQYSDSINCSACSSSGGGGGSGSSGTIDLTPMVLAINNLNNSIREQFEDLFELIRKYYTDYKNASNTHVSQTVTYSSYSQSDNWFSRMEMLLFAASGLTVENEEVDNPDTSEISSFRDSVEENITSSSDDLTEHFSEQGKFRAIYDKLADIFEKFSFLGNGSAEINSPFFSDNVTIGNYDFGPVSLPSELSSTLSRIFTLVRYGFQAFYMVFFAFVLYFLIISAYKQGKDIFISAMQIYASLFGGGS